MISSMEFTEESRDISKPTPTSTIFKHSQSHVEDHGGGNTWFVPNEGKTRMRPEMAVSSMLTTRNVLSTSKQAT